MKYCIERISLTDSEIMRESFRQADEARKARVLALKTVQAQKQCLCADALARRMLSEECRVAPQHLRFIRDENGKPFLQNFNIHFNISHSGDFVLCALHSKPIGADIESIRVVKPSLFSRICTSDEEAWCAADTKKLLQLWTAKEAYLKYLGIGLRCAPNEISVLHSGTLSLPDLALESQLCDQYAASIVYGL